MTEEQDKLLSDFYVRMRQLMHLCDRLKSENEVLRQQLQEKDAEISSLQREAIHLKTKYEALQAARSLYSGESGGDAEKAKARLVKLVREVDKCIALLKT